MERPKEGGRKVGVNETHSEGKKKKICKVGEEMKHCRGGGEKKKRGVAVGRDEGEMGCRGGSVAQW